MLSRFKSCAVRGAAVLILLLAAGGAVAEKVPFSLVGTFHQFRAEAGKSDLEIFYRLNPESWTYVEQETGVWIGKVMLSLAIDHKGQCIYEDRWAMQDQQSTAKPANDFFKMDLMRLKVPSGRYTVKIKAVDLNDSSKQDSVQAEVLIPSYSSRNVSLSDLVLCREIREVKADETGLFIKNGHFVLPSSITRFNNRTGMLQFYVEGYSLLTAVKADSFKIRYYVENQEGLPVEGLPFIQKTVLKDQDQIVKWGKISLSDVSPGEYKLNVFVINLEDELLASAQRSFEVYQAKSSVVAREATDVTGYDALSLAGNFTPEEELAYITYIMNPQEKNIAKDIDDESGQKEFLDGFWKLKDPTPETERNELREAYLQRGREANQMFSQTGRQGFQTDFGRIYLMYGNPNDIQKFSNTSSGRRYQTWRYDEIQGGVEFVFVDITGVNDFQLVHSTMRGEVQDYDWERLLELDNRMRNDDGSYMFR